MFFSTTPKPRSRFGHSTVAPTRSGLLFSPRIVCNDTVILLEHAIAHLGIAVLPKFITRPAIEQHQLNPVLANWLIKQVDINALYPSYKGISPAVRGIHPFSSATL